MTIERSERRAGKLRDICVATALDASLGEGKRGPHLPNWLYEKAGGEDGLEFRWAIETVGGKFLDTALISKWIDCLARGKVDRSELNRYCRLTRKLTEEDYEEVRSILAADCLWSEKKLYAALLMAGKAALRSGLSLGVSLMSEKNCHFKLVEMSRIGGVLLFDTYDTQEGICYGPVHLVLPGDVSDRRLDFSTNTRLFFYYPLTKRHFDLSAFVFFKLDFDSGLLERGKP